MTRSIEFRPEARVDFDEAADWYEDQSEGLRAKFVLSVDETLARIENSPLAFPVVEGTMIRRAIVNRFPYAILFAVVGDKIAIYSVFHMSRNPIIWRGRID